MLVALERVEKVTEKRRLEQSTKRLVRVSFDLTESHVPKRK